MLRACQPELLDHLPPDNPGAVGSRRDLRRLNAWMGNARFMADALKSFLPNLSQPQILEIGAGDGTFCLKVAKRLHPRLSAPAAVLLDRQNLITSATRAQFLQLGYDVESAKADVFEYLQGSKSQNPTHLTGPTSPTSPTCLTSASYDAIIANLFLQHFSDDQLSELFHLAQKRTSLFIAVEPRRSPVSVFAGKFLWAIGCNSVTRHDAAISIRAGFSGQELSSLWPQTHGWTCEERPAGFSSHLFIAKRSLSPASALPLEKRTGQKMSSSSAFSL